MWFLLSNILLLKKLHGSLESRRLVVLKPLAHLVRRARPVYLSDDLCAPIMTTPYKTTNDIMSIEGKFTNPSTICLYLGN